MALEVNMADIKTLQAPATPSLPITPTVYSEKHFDILNNVLRLYFNQINGFTIGLNSNIVALSTLGAPSAGPTEDRPVNNLQVGQQYFDTTLGFPVFWNGTEWVSASGTTFVGWGA